MKILGSVLQKNILALFTLKGAEYLASFITLPYLLRILEPDGYGNLIFFQVVMGYIVLFVDYGFALTAPRDIAQAEKEHIPRVFSSVLGAKFFLMLAGILIVFGICALVPEKTGVRLLLWMLPSLIGSAIFPGWYFQGIQRMKFITIFNVIARVFGALGVFIFVHKVNDMNIAAFFLAIPQLVAGIMGMGMLFAQNHRLFLLPSWQMVWKELVDGWNVFISTLFMQAYTNSNLLILRLLTDDYIVGCYAAAHKFIEAIKGLLVPISNAVYPYISSLLLESRDRALLFLRKILRLIGGGMLIVTIVIFISSEQIIFLLMGGVYPDSVLILRTLSVVPFLVGLSNVLGIQTMLAFGFQRQFSRIVMASAILNFCLVWWMIYAWQGEGLAIVMVIVESFVTVIMALFLHKEQLLM